MGKVILVCVKDGSKLRIKFQKYIRDDNKEFDGVYNNTFNCRFPKNIREENKRYEIPEEEIQSHFTL